MILNENTADCTRRAESPLKNMCSLSSVQSILNAKFIESSRWTLNHNKKTHEKCTELFQIDYSKKKKNAFYTCSRARTMSKGFVIIVVVKPPSAPAVHWINKWDAFEGKMLIKLSEKETLNVQLIFRMPRAIEPVLLHLDRDDKMSTIKQNSERMPSNWPNSLDSNPWSHPFA